MGQFFFVLFIIILVIAINIAILRWVLRINHIIDREKPGDGRNLGTPYQFSN